MEKILNDKLYVLAECLWRMQKAGRWISFGPSDMMDGRWIYSGVLDDKGIDTLDLCSSHASTASAFLWPIRDALDSAPKWIQKTYISMNSPAIQGGH